ncbi:hypothetical protein PYCC9005_005513 [Savitreella phatthalungensis]
MLCEFMKDEAERRKARELKEHRSIGQKSGRALMRNNHPMDLTFEHMHKMWWYGIALCVIEDVDNGILLLEPVLEVEWSCDVKDQPYAVRLHVAIDKEVRSASVVDQGTRGSPAETCIGEESTATMSDGKIPPIWERPAGWQRPGPFKKHGLDQSGFPGFLERYCSNPCRTPTRGCCSERTQDMRTFMIPNCLTCDRQENIFRAPELTQVSTTSMDDANHWCCSYNFPSPLLPVLRSVCRLPKTQISPALAEQLLKRDPAVTWTFSAQLIFKDSKHSIPRKLQTARLFYDTVRAKDAICLSIRSIERPQSGLAYEIEPSTYTVYSEQLLSATCKPSEWIQIS